MTTQQIGYSATISDSATSGGTYVTWAQVVDVDLPEPEVKKQDASHLNMTSRSMLFIPGLVDGKTVKVKQVFDKTEFARIATLRGTSPHYFKITNVNADVYTWSGFIQSIRAKLDENTTMMEVEIVVSGDVTVA